MHASRFAIDDGLSRWYGVLHIVKRRMTDILRGSHIQGSFPVVPEDLLLLEPRS